MNNTSFDRQCGVPSKAHLPTHQRVYFATNREHMQSTYTTGIDSALKYGEADIIVPPTIQEGQELVWSQGPAYHVIFQPKETALRESRVEFIQHLGRCLKTVPTKELLIYIHGFNVTFEAAVTNAGLLAHHTGFRGLTVAFDWASYGSAFRCDCPLWGNDRYRMDDSYEVFTELLLELVEGVEGLEQVHIMTHSMGAYMLYKIMQGMDNTFAERIIPRVNTFIFAAPDIGKQQFDFILARTAKHRSSHLSMTVYTSGGDLALFLSSFLHLFKRRVGLFVKPLYGTRHLFCPFAFEGVDVVDVSGHASDSAGHSYFTSSIDVLRDIGVRIRSGTGGGECAGYGVPSSSPSPSLTRISSGNWRCCPNLQRLVSLKEDGNGGEWRSVEGLRNTQLGLQVIARNSKNQPANLKSQAGEFFPAQLIQVVHV